MYNSARQLNGSYLGIGADITFNRNSSNGNTLSTELIQFTGYTPTIEFADIASTLAILNHNELIQAIFGLSLNPITQNISITEASSLNIPCTIDTLISNDHVKFFIHTNEDHQKDTNGNFIIQIGHKRAGKIGCEMVETFELWSTILHSNKGLPPFKLYTDLANKLANITSEYSDSGFNYISGMPELMIEKNSKYFNNLSKIIERKDETSIFSIDVGKNKKNKYIDLTNEISRILKKELQVNNNLDLNIEGLFEENNISK